MKNKDKRIKKDTKILKKFIHVYCKNHHGVHPDKYCPECKNILEYALEKYEKCPLDPKPKCKDCHIHCYTPEMRLTVREIMRYSGIYFVKRGRLDWLFRYFF